MSRALAGVWCLSKAIKQKTRIVVVCAFGMWGTIGHKAVATIDGAPILHPKETPLDQDSRNLLHTTVTTGANSNMYVQYTIFPLIHTGNGLGGKSSGTRKIAYLTSFLDPNSNLEILKSTRECAISTKPTTSTPLDIIFTIYRLSYIKGVKIVLVSIKP